MSYQKMETSSPVELPHGLHKLTPSNPLDQFILLFWLFFQREKPKLYIDQYGEANLKQTGLWLFSTLLWLPLVISIAAGSLEGPPFFQEPLEISWMAWLLAVIGVWLLVPLLGRFVEHRKIFAMLIGIAAGAALMLAVYIHSVSMVFAPAILLLYAVAYGLATSQMIGVNKRIATFAVVVTVVVLIAATIYGSILGTMRNGRLPSEIGDALFWLPFFLIPLFVVFWVTFLFASGVSKVIDTGKPRLLKTVTVWGFFASYLILILWLL